MRCLGPKPGLGRQAAGDVARIDPVLGFKSRLKLYGDGGLSRPLMKRLLRVESPAQPASVLVPMP